MGLLDFLKKNKVDEAPSFPPDVETTPPVGDTGAENLLAEDSAEEITPENADSAPVQPQMVIKAEEPLNLRPPRQDAPPTVRAFDEFGRQVEIPLTQWREMMLATAEQAQDDPERLYGVIADALQLKLADDVLPAARRLYEIDPDTERGTTILGIVLMETGDATAAARLYADYLAAQRDRGEGPSAVVMVNHAKALVAMGEKAAGHAMLWQGIEADPNQENGLGWFAALERERGGQAAFVAALERAAALPGAWQPQVWLAREALEHNDLATAKALYKQALERAGKPAPAVLLQSLTGDLGNRGHLEEALALARPAYDARVHGLPVGNNLIKASLDTGRLDDARAMVEELQRMNRPEWVQHLQFWETEIRRTELAKEGKLPEAQPELTALAIEGPVWLPSGSPARALFGKPGGGKVLFLGATVAYAAQPEALQGMLPDAMGRLSRALPLFLAESAFLHMGLDANTIVPWVTGHGFAVMGGEWAEADAAEYARNADAVAAVVLHLQQTGDTTEAHMRVVPAQRHADAAPVQTLTAPVDWQQAGGVALQLWSQMAHSLLQVADGGESAHLDPARYQIPTGAALGNYLLRLEQLLAVRCAGSEKPERPFLTGEREIVQGQLHLALEMPGSLPLRLILHETLMRLKDLRPEIVAEARKPVEALQERQPLPDPDVQAVLARQLKTIYRDSGTPTA